MSRVGVWLFGARGSVATTTVAGAAALRHGLPPAGMVTAAPAFAAAGLVPVEDLVFGGHHVTELPLARQVERLVAGGVLPAGLSRTCSWSTYRISTTTCSGTVRRPPRPTRPRPGWTA